MIAMFTSFSPPLILHSTIMSITAKGRGGTDWWSKIDPSGAGSIDADRLLLSLNMEVRPLVLLLCVIRSLFVQDSEPSVTRVLKQHTI